MASGLASPTLSRRQSDRVRQLDALGRRAAAITVTLLTGRRVVMKTTIQWIRGLPGVGGGVFFAGSG